jgi:uncharacterized cupin superfamily protein
VADWYVHNVREFPWFVNEKFGARSFLVPFEEGIQFGARVHVLEPGKPSTLYHRETEQEGFLVVEGECLLIVEGEERRLRQWDYFHCAPNTTHAFVGAGDGPCLMVTIGMRSGSIVYPRDEAALAHGAGVEVETDTPDVAYAPFTGWEEGRPASWDRLPWNR